MTENADSPVARAREKLAAVLRAASEELLADGDAEGARIAMEHCPLGFQVT